jgi:F-type H+-transporting ATPase subunit b
VTPAFDLSFNPAVAFWTLVSFALVYYVISRKIYPVLNKLMSARAAKIAQGLTEAEAGRRTAEELAKQAEERLQNIRLEERRILSEAQEKARRSAAEQSAEYLAEFQRLRANKEEDLRKIEADFYKNFEAQLGGILGAACEKIIRCDLPPELQQKILNERLAELKKIKEF